MDSNRQLGLAYSGKNRVFRAWVQSTLANPKGAVITVAERIERLALFDRAVLESGVFSLHDDELTSPLGLAFLKWVRP